MQSSWWSGNYEISAELEMLQVSLEDIKWDASLPPQSCPAKTRLPLQVLDLRVAHSAGILIS